MTIDDFSSSSNSSSSESSPSTAIDKRQLHDVKVVAEAHNHLQNKEKAPTLCQLLAREFFYALLVVKEAKDHQLQMPTHSVCLMTR